MMPVGIFWSQLVNSQVIMDKIDFDGTISKQDFSKIKRKIVPKSVDIFHSLADIHDNEISDPLNIKQEYHREFQHSTEEKRCHARAGKV